MIMMNELMLYYFLLACILVLVVVLAVLVITINQMATEIPCQSEDIGVCEVK